jgi:hypothetical protein
MKNPINPKQDLAIRLRLYINHKRVLAEKCTSHYTDATISKSMRLVYDLLQMVKKDYCANHSLNQLCSMILMHETNLRNILPRMAHSHYEKQLMKLEAILTDARKLKAA